MILLQSNNYENKEKIINGLTDTLYDVSTVKILTKTCRYLDIKGYSNKRKYWKTKKIIEKLYNNYVNKVDNKLRIEIKFNERINRIFKYTILIHYIIKIFN